MGIRPHHAAVADLLAAAGGKGHIHGVDAAQVIQHIARFVAQAGMPAPLGQGFPQH